MKHQIFAVISFLVICSPLAKANETLTIDVADGATQTYTAQLGAGVDLVKTGTGKLIVSNDFNTAFNGTVTIKAGILEAQSGLLSNHRVFGSAAANTIIVEKGAQLITSVPGPKSQGDKQFPNNLVLAGDGPDGTGALRAYRYTGVSGSGSNCDALFGNVTLADDAMVRIECRTGFANGTINFNGHRLSLYKGSNGTFMVYGGSVWNAGSAGAELIVTNGTEATHQGTVKYQGDGTVVIASGAKFNLWGPALTCPWKVRFDGSGSLNVGSGTSDSANNVTGPIEMKGNVTFGTYSSTANMRQHLSGVLSGAGKMTKAGIHTLFLDNPANTWTGGTAIGGTSDDLTSTLVPKTPGALSRYDQAGKVAVNANGVLALPATGWTAENARTLMANGTIASTGTIAPWTVDGDAAWSGDWFTKKARLGHVDAGRFETDTTLPDGSQIWVKSGTLALTGAKDRHISLLQVPAGTLEVSSGFLHASNATTRLGGRLVLKDGASFLGLYTNLTLKSIPNMTLPTVDLGSTGTTPAVLDLDGGAFTGKVYATSSGKAVYNLREGSELVQMSGPSADGYFSRGSTGYGYLNQTGGKLLVRAHSGMMQGGSTGMYEMKGGMFDYTSPDSSNFTMSRGYGWGEFYQTGGTFDPYTRFGKSFYMGIQSWSDSTGGVAIATLDGVDAFMKVDHFDMGQRTTNFVSTLNLNAGVLQTKYIEHAAATRVNCPGYVNFNGGTLRALANNTDVFGSGTKKCARVTVYEKGATFDTAGFTQRIYQVALSAPTGKGVTQIAIPSGAATTGYFGPPEVKITGDGTGATAHCLFDETTGKIGPIVVTSPGCGFTNAKATIRNAARTADVTLTVTLGTSIGGGLVKKGAGTLELACANTYTGVTRVEEGTLKLAVTGAIPAANDLLLAGGRVECAAGVNPTFARVGGSGELTSGTYTVTKGLVFDAKDLLTNAIFSVGTGVAMNLPANPDIRISNGDLLKKTGTPITLAVFPAGTFTAVPKVEGTSEWGASVSEDGSTLLLVAKATPSLDVSRPRIGTPMTVAFAADGVQSGTETATWYRSTGTDRAYGTSVHAEGLAYTPTAADCEHWFKVVVADADGVRLTQEFFFSRLPVCYIDVANGAEPSAQKEEHDATIRIQGNGAYAQQYDGATTIHVRGNSTKGYPKKPWKIKLDKKTDVFGLGGGVKNKHWVLLANYLDECMMRNTIGFRLADALGVANMKTEWVDVILNGSYNGCYQFCQHIRVGEDRVPVYDWENMAGKVAEAFAKANPLTDDELDELTTQLEEDLSWVTTDAFTYKGVTAQPSKLGVKKFSNDISGGYLWEMSSEFDELSQFVVTSGVMTVKTMLNRPEYLFSNPTMMAKCQEIWQHYWDACTSTNGYNSSGEHYSELCDVDSMVGYWLVMVTMNNSDSTKKSRYAYKDQKRKIVWGPVWDFDWGCGSPVTLSTNKVNGIYPWSGATNTFGVATSTGIDDQKVTAGGFYKEWSDDPWFCRKAYEKYWEVVHPYYAELVREGGTIDQYAELLAEAGAANERKWKYRVGFSGPDGDVARYKKYLKDRLDWMDKQFKNVSTLMAAVRTSSSTAPYTRSASTAVALTSGLGAATSDTASPETEIADLKTFKGQNVHATVAAGMGSQVAVYANGLLVARTPLAVGAATVTVPFANLAADAKSVLAVDVEDANGKVVARTFSFVAPTQEWATTVTETNKVEFAWLAQIVPELVATGTPTDFERVAEQKPSPLGKSRPLSYDWIVGTNPTNEEDVLTAEIKLVEGVPEVTWKPDLRPTRVYTVKGAEKLTDEFVAPTNSMHRFFKVEVKLGDR